MRGFWGRLVVWGLLVAVGGVWGVAAPAWAPAVEPWASTVGCRLIDHPGNDGDSFHVRMPDGSEKIFRLYFVDAAETSRKLGERLGHQATYWGVARAEALALGKQASRVTRDHLKEPFTVHTRLQDAKGNSQQPRYFAMVELADGFLSEALVSAGLARIYGMPVDLPDGTGRWVFRGRLQGLEKVARQKGTGAWPTPGEAKNQVGHRGESE